MDRATTNRAGASRAKVEALAAVERERFEQDRPRSMRAAARAAATMPRGVPMSWMDELYDHPPLWVSHGHGSRFWDVDGHEYVDMYVADMSAAARAALTEVLNPAAFASTARLGAKLADGLRAQIEHAGLPWSVNQHGAHAFYFFSPQPPRDAHGARDTEDPDLRALIRLFLANRGVWESGWWLGPTVSVAHTAEDVEVHLAAIGEFADAVT